MLILVCGLPGTGKTTVAEAIARKAKASILSTDILRKEAVFRPSYGDEEKGMVYGMLFSMAEMMLKDSKSVLLDGTFYKKELRDAAREVAAGTRSGFRLVEVVCDESVVRVRLEKRREAGGSASDADFTVYQKIKRIFEPIEENHFVIDTGSDLEKQIDVLIRNLKTV
jgi:predicted kinase